MATALDMLKNLDEGTTTFQVDEKNENKVRFRICLQYLKAESTVEDYFLDKLPDHIKPSNRSNGKLWKGSFFLFIYLIFFSLSLLFSCSHSFLFSSLLFSLSLSLSLSLSHCMYTRINPKFRGLDL